MASILLNSFCFWYYFSKQSGIICVWSQDSWVWLQLWIKANSHSTDRCQPTQTISIPSQIFHNQTNIWKIHTDLKWWSDLDKVSVAVWRCSQLALRKQGKLLEQGENPFTRTYNRWESGISCCDPPLPPCSPSCYWGRAIPLYAAVKLNKNNLCEFYWSASTFFLLLVKKPYRNIHTSCTGKPGISSLNSYANFVE